MKKTAVILAIALLCSCSFELTDGSPAKKNIDVVVVQAEESAKPAATQAPPSPEPKTEAPATPAPKTETPATIAPKTETPATIAPTAPPEPENTSAVPVSSAEMNPARILPLPETPNNPYPSKYGSPYTASGALSNEKQEWYYGKNKNYQPPTAQSKFDIREFGGYYLGDITQKELYLTFDEGYENGFTPSILDTLKEKNVTACFFVTQPFVKANPEIIKRMIDEGHVVGSHSVNHKSSPSLSDEEMASELTGLAEFYYENTGHEIDMFFRPPMGEYSARTLKIANELGYKSIFWSFAYQDWLVDNQPGMETAFNQTVSHMHNGAIILLHAVSQSNTEALPYIIDCLKANGFVFKSLYDLPK